MPALRWFPTTTLLLVTLCLHACGNNAENNMLTPAAELVRMEEQVPAVSGEMDADALSWLNFRRRQAGLQSLVRSQILDQAAKAHANYQQSNNVVTHQEIPGTQGFSGANPLARLYAAGMMQDSTAIMPGEVIAAVKNQDGFAAAEGLIGAIYHRFVIFEPAFNEAGAGEAASANGYRWLNINMIGIQTAVQHHAQLFTWPASGQRNIRPSVLTNLEYPDPLPQQDAAGFPISAHTRTQVVLHVDSFTVRPLGGTPLIVRLLTYATDETTPPSAAAIIPLMALQPLTIYDVEFSGRMDAQPVSLRWWFMTGR